MRSRAFVVVALAALLEGQAASMPAQHLMLVRICGQPGSLPIPFNRDGENDSCLKACHAICGRKAEEEPEAI